MKTNQHHETTLYNDENQPKTIKSPWKARKTKKNHENHENCENQPKTIRTWNYLGKTWKPTKIHEKKNLKKHKNMKLPWKLKKNNQKP